MAISSRTSSNEEWKGDRLDALTALHRFVQGTDEPLVQLEVLDDVEWTAFHDRDGDIRGRARAIVDAVVGRTDTLETRVFVDGFGNRYHLHEGDPRARDFAAEQEAHSKLLRDTATVLVAHHTPETFLAWADERLHTAERLRVQTSPGPFLGAVARAGGSVYATELSRRLLAAPAHPLASYVHVVLIALAETDSVGALTLAREAVASGNPTLAAGVGAIFAHDHEFTADERSLVQDLLGHRDLGVRRATLGWLRWALRRNLDFIATLLRTFDIGGDVSIAKQLGDLFNQHNIPPGDLPTDVLDRLTRQLAMLLEIDDYWIGDFIAEAARVVPQSVTQMLLDRIARSESDDAPDGYDAIPFQLHFDARALAERPDYEAILRSVRDALLPRTPWRSWDVPKLFVALAVLDHPTTLQLLDEWFESGDAEKIDAAAKLLSDAPRDFVFTHQPYVARVLDQAWTVSENCYDRVVGHLFGPVISELKSGSHGYAFPQDERHRERASEAMQDLQPHSPAWRFYDSIRQHAEREIERKRLSDEDLDDEYLG